jgi:hypothetical protein
LLLGPLLELPLAEIAAAAADNAARSRLDLSVAAVPVGVDSTAGGALSSVFGHPASRSPPC